MNAIARQLNIRQLNISQFEKKIFWTILSLFIIFSAYYAYLVNQTIFNIVARENAENESVTLNSKISEDEFKYISLKNDVNLDYAYSVGFSNVKNIAFASRKLPNQNLTVNAGVKLPY